MARNRSYIDWAEAFTIFAKYTEEDDYGYVSAELDIIYAGYEVTSDEDRQRLEELGWHWDDSLETFYHHA